MKSERFALRGAIYLLLINDKKEVLLLRRFNTGWKDGWYSLVAGHLDGGESVTQAMIREAKEEAGISIDKKDIHVVHTMHMNSNYEYVNFFLYATKWAGEPKNLEPNKCDDLSWFPLDKLPENILPHVKQAIESCERNVTFSEFGWE